MPRNHKALFSKPRSIRKIGIIGYMAIKLSPKGAKRRYKKSSFTLGSLESLFDQLANS